MRVAYNQTYFVRRMLGGKCRLVRRIEVPRQTILEIVFEGSTEENLSRYEELAENLNIAKPICEHVDIPNHSSSDAITCVPHKGSHL